jgi:nucleotidyltransferase AbiEii toxin of type IV toxin-antitoxin system
VTEIRLQGILEALVRHEVDFVLIGGLAAAVHGSRRVSLDVDIIAAPDPGNMKRLASAIGELGHTKVVDEHFRDLDPTDDFDLARAGNLRIDTGLGRLDLLKNAAGASRYDVLRAASMPTSIGSVDVPVVSRDHLIAMKVAAGRPKDLQDVADITAADASG